MSYDPWTPGPPPVVKTPRGAFTVRQQDGDGPPLVLLHGWPESSYSWAAMARHLPHLSVIAPDLRGMGDSPREGHLSAFTKDSLAEDVLSIMDVLGVRQFAVVGHDWGGIVAQEIALVVPERVVGLGIANIAVINNLDTNRRIAQQSRNRFMWYQHFFQTELADALLPGNERAWLSHFLRAWRSEGFPTDVLDECVRWHGLPGTSRATANYYRSYAKDIQRWNALQDHRFLMPSLYVHGVQDVVITPDYLEGVERCFASLRLERLESGHFVQDEQPAALAALIKDWHATL